MTSNDEPFLARWSRRKREVERPQEPPVEASPTPAPGPPQADVSDVDPSAPDRRDEPPFDITKLPSLDSIDAATDIRAFLARGVPAALGREALRRAWLADPAVRDFIGPAENAWDFTAPGGVPGFGPMLPPAPVGLPADLVRQATQPELPTLPESVPANAQEPAPAAGGTVVESQREVGPHRIVNSGRDPDAQIVAAVESNADRIADKQSEDVALPEANIDAELGAVLPGRRHGGALPE